MLWEWLVGVVSKLSVPVLRAVTGPAKELSGTVKDLTSVRRDLVETKVAQKKLDEYEDQIQKASLDDVTSFDPKTRRIIAAGQYEIRRSLGSGGFGVAYLATHRQTNQAVVVKQMTEGGVQNALRNEGVILRGLSHPHIVALLDVIEEDDRVELVLEYIEGQTLQQITQSRDVEATTAVFLRILPQIASALDYVHRMGLIHREVKPANIMVQADGSAKLIDFGIARRTADAAGTGFVAGTPLYMAPEQWRGESFDGRIDQYALGVIAYEVLTGRLPFDSGSGSHHELAMAVIEAAAPSPSALRPELGPDVGRALLRALAKVPQERFATCNDFAQALIAAVPRRPL